VNIDVERLFKLAKRYLEKNDFGIAHTKRVFDIAKENLGSSRIMGVDFFFDNFT
jgi:hypothetical protein